jgi:hypothetical protein
MRGKPGKPRCDFLRTLAILSQIQLAVLPGDFCGYIFTLNKLVWTLPNKASRHLFRDEKTGFTAAFRQTSTEKLWKLAYLGWKSFVQTVEDFGGYIQRMPSTPARRPHLSG